MRDALSQAGRPIFYSMCQWGKDQVWTWGSSVGNSWRMSDDINDHWPSMAGIASAASLMSQYAGPGGFNDLDMMVRRPSPRTMMATTLVVPSSST